MRSFQFRLSTLVGLVAAVALACGWAVAWRRWQAGSARPAQRIVAAVLADRAARPTACLSSGEDLALPALVVLGAVAISRARRGVTAMAEQTTGGFEYRGRTYRFGDAQCRWMPGHLYVEAKGNRCGLRLVGVPYPGVMEVAELPGRVWEPDEEQLSLYADTFAEGGLEVRDKELWIMGGRVECRRYDAGRGILTVSFRLAIQDGEYGGEHEADGVAYCRVVSAEEAGA